MRLVWERQRDRIYFPGEDFPFEPVVRTWSHGRRGRITGFLLGAGRDHFRIRVLEYSDVTGALYEDGTLTVRREHIKEIDMTEETTLSTTETWMDRHHDLWTEGSDGLMYSPGTAPFPREHVEKKWGPLVRMVNLPVPEQISGDEQSALERIIDAWDSPSTRPNLHEYWKRNLRTNWPALAEAIEAAPRGGR